MNFATGEGSKAKAWKDIWGCGQGISVMEQVMTTAEYVARIKREYMAAKARIGARDYAFA